jgi:hypothetical protein
VIEATGGRVPVGAVGYGGESVHALAALFAADRQPSSAPR